MAADDIRRMHGLADDMWGHFVGNDAFVLRLLLGVGESPNTVDHVDAHIYLADGTHRIATFITPDAVQEILLSADARYFWCSDLVLIPHPGVSAMVAAVAAMIRTRDLETMCTRIEGGPDSRSPSAPLRP